MAKNSGKYVPDAGDYIWIDFDPAIGREQKGKRPALVLSPKSYNEFGYLLCVPVTSRTRTYAFSVLVADGTIQGSILCDQVKSIDWRKREFGFISKSNESILREVTKKIHLLLPEI